MSGTVPSTSSSLSHFVLTITLQVRDSRLKQVSHLPNMTYLLSSRARILSQIPNPNNSALDLYMWILGTFAIIPCDIQNISLILYMCYIIIISLHIISLHTFHYIYIYINVQNIFLFCEKRKKAIDSDK